MGVLDFIKTTVSYLVYVMTSQSQFIGQFQQIFTDFVLSNLNNCESVSAEVFLNFKNNLFLFSNFIVLCQYNC